MSDPQSTPSHPAPPTGLQPLPGPPPPSGFGALPRWMRFGIIAAAAAVVALGVSVLVRVAVSTPAVPQGVIPAADLAPGSCLLEPGSLDEYTVVGCGRPHHQQVIAVVDLAFPGVLYDSDESLAIYAQSACERLLEYRLYLPDDLEKQDFAAAAIAPPTLAQYEVGGTETRCAVFDDPDRPDEGGVSDDLTDDLYRSIPD